MARIKGHLEQVIFAGPTATCLVRVNGKIFKVLAKNQELEGLPAAGTVWLSWHVNRGMVLDQET